MTIKEILSDKVAVKVKHKNLAEMFEISGDTKQESVIYAKLFKGSQIFWYEEIRETENNNGLCMSNELFFKLNYNGYTIITFAELKERLK